MTHAEFATKNQTFRVACQLAGIDATSRQASKFRRKTGTAYEWKDDAEWRIHHKLD